MYEYAHVWMCQEIPMVEEVTFLCQSGRIRIFLQSFLEFGHEHEHQKSLEGDFFSNHYWKVGGLWSVADCIASGEIRSHLSTKLGKGDKFNQQPGEFTSKLAAQHRPTRSHQKCVTVRSSSG